MIHALLLCAAVLLSPSNNEAVNPRISAARALQQSLAQENGGGESGLAHSMEAATATVTLLGESAFGETLEEAVLEARWRAVTDPALAAERLREDLRRAVDDLRFEPLVEAELPVGFPDPTPVREIELKQYPAYRMVRADMRGQGSNGAFWRLFGHIKKNQIAMTAPVEMTYAGARDGFDETAMAFLYGSLEIGEVGVDGDVEVIDVSPVRIASIGCRGAMSRKALDAARDRLLRWVASRKDLEIAGEVRSMGYNSPMVPTSKRYFEVQIPVKYMDDSQSDKMVIDFGDEQEAGRWSTVNDVVMGGLSSSRFAPSDAGSLVFTGRVSLDNNGGFASVRREPSDMGLEGASALRLSFRGDGRAYKLRLRTNDAYDGVNYEVAFSTEDGLWSERIFSLEEFTPVWRGRRVPNAPELDPARVRSVGFLISDKQEGAFRLEVRMLSKE